MRRIEDLSDDEKDAFCGTVVEVIERDDSDPEYIVEITSGEKVLCPQAWLTLVTVH